MALHYHKSFNDIDIYHNTNKMFVKLVRFVYNGSEKSSMVDVYNTFQELYNTDCLGRILELARSTTGDCKNKLVIDIAPSNLNRALKMQVIR